MKIVFIVLGVFAALIVIPRLIMSLKAMRMKGRDAPLTHRPSRNRIRSGKKTLLYFHTPACGACKIQGPVIEKLEKLHRNAMFKIDASKERKVASSYGVMGVPFVVLIENGKIVKEAPGIQREAAIKNFFNGKN